jgi:glycerol-3-phosphate acyltransferase PlsX
MKLAVDVMGGDNAPQAVLDGVLAFLNEKEAEGVDLKLFGNEDVLKEFTAAHPEIKDRIETVYTTETIEMGEHPTEAIRKKKNSSLVKALEAVRDKEADCFFSAGSTGAVLTGATLIVRRHKGIKRPALATLIPTTAGTVTEIIDCGANTDCKPGYLVQFALMGAAYLEAVEGVKNPRVGLLCNGTEEEKGNALVKEAHQRLMAVEGLNFIGNVEARDLTSGAVDVLVCDGFDGNVMLKTTEGVAKWIATMLKKSLMESTRGKLAGLIGKPAFNSLKKKLDYTEYGGAPLLGINGGIIKGHGSSDAKSVKVCLLQATRLVRGGVTEKIGAFAETLNIED